MSFSWMLMLFLILLFSIKHLHRCPIFLNLNSREPQQSPTPKSEFTCNRRKVLQAHSLHFLLPWRQASFPVWSFFLIVLINNNITPKPLRFWWLLAGWGKWGELLLSVTSFRASLCSAAHSRGLIQSPYLWLTESLSALLSLRTP